MQNIKPNSGRSNLAKIAAASESTVLRDAICETELKECQRKLQNDYNIKKSLEDPGRLRTVLKIRSFVYGRMADLYSIKGDNIMADYYRLLEDAIHVAVTQGELADQQRGIKGAQSKQQNGTKGRKIKAAKPDARKK